MDALDLLFRRLVLAARAANALARPIDVGELMDRLAPYRAARRDGALDTNDDYLHAVMQLLAGEREYVFADELMQDDLRNELKGTNPDLTLLRTYVNTKIRIAQQAAEKVLAGDTTIDLRPPTPIATAAVPAPPGTPAAPAPAPRMSPDPQDAPTAVINECPYCTQLLPPDRQMHYCPNCGMDLTVRRCAGCSAEIESGWKYCVTCGRSAA